MRGAVMRIAAFLLGCVSASLWCLVALVALIVCCIATPICAAADVVASIWDGGHDAR